MIFDLFGTLVPNNRDEPYHESVRQMARLLGADAERFLAVWTGEELTAKRFTGAFASQGDCIRHVLGVMGASATEEAIVRAAEVRAQYTRDLLTPRPGAIETVREVRRRGGKTALMTACSTDTPAAFQATAMAGLFDATLFSSVEGLTKPDGRFYALARERLGVQAGECLYVGDGAGRELPGALAAGMTPVLLCDPSERDIVLVRPGVCDWPGLRIEAVPEVLGILDGR
ncbi:MAG: HAD family hydrolase [Planctomycetota bacterium]|nr:HAD family hydrolase [Planctomycetota bacterium]